MKKIYYLKTCDTCQRIIRELDGLPGFDFQNIKEQNVEADVLDMLAEKTGSYEALFSRRARKYKAMGLGDIELTEQDYRKLILKEYTFLKRPVIIVDNEVFVGNAQSTVAAAKAAITD